MACPYCGAPGGGAGSCGSCQHHRSGSSVQGAYRSGGGGGGECFPADSLVLTPRGLIRIDSIKKGSSVLGVSRDGTLKPFTVKRVDSHEPGPLLFVRSFQADRSFHITKLHAVSTKRGWIKARNLKSGDEVSFVDENGRTQFHKVRAVETSSKIAGLYNLIVDGDHNFIVQGCIAHSFVRFRLLRCAINSLFSPSGAPLREVTSLQ